MAPSKRKEGKKQLAIWINEDTFDNFKAACAFLGVTMTDILTACIESKVYEYKIKKRKGWKEN